MTPQQQKTLRRSAWKRAVDAVSHEQCAVASQQKGFLEEAKHSIRQSIHLRQVANAALAELNREEQQP